MTRHIACVASIPCDLGGGMLVRYVRIFCEPPSMHQRVDADRCEKRKRAGSDLNADGQTCQECLAGLTAAILGGTYTAHTYLLVRNLQAVPHPGLLLTWPMLRELPED